jgi:hypothetical protein
MAGFDFEALMLDKVRTSNPGLDVSRASIWSELSSRPFLGFNSLVEQLIGRDAIARDIRKFAEMTDDELDALAANFWVFRKTGTTAVGTVTAYYSVPQDVAIGFGQPFVSKTGAVFIATAPVVLSKAQVSLAFDPVQNAYRVDIPSVQSTGTGDFFNVGVNDIVQMSSQTDNVILVTNLTPFSTSIARETNAELAARIIDSASMRNLCSADSTTALVKSDLRVNAVSVIGAGDPEMIRDITFGVHINGLQDTFIYPKTPLIPYIVEGQVTGGGITFPSFTFVGRDLSATFTGEPPVFNPDSAGPVVFISKVEFGTGIGSGFTAQGTMTLGEDFTYQFIGTGNVNNKNSDLETWRVIILRNPVPSITDTTIRITALRAPLISALQFEFRTSGKRSTSHTTLFKSFIPVFLDVSATIKPKNGASNIADFYVQVIRDLIASTPIAIGLDGSDIIAQLEDFGADRVEIPIIATGRVLYPDLSEATAAFQNNVNLTSLERLEVGASIRTMALYPGTITVTLE